MVLGAGAAGGAADGAEGASFGAVAGAVGAGACRRNRIRIRFHKHYRSNLPGAAGPRTARTAMMATRAAGLRLAGR